MNDFDYNFLYKDELFADTHDLYSVDCFLSSYNPSERVTSVFSKVKALHKNWIVHHEYALNITDLPEDAFLANKTNIDDYSESDFVHEIENSNIGKQLLSCQSICIDTTGFIKPYIMALIAWLKVNGKSKFDLLFSEPLHYTKKGKTEFAGEFFDCRIVSGYGGSLLSVGDKEEILVIGSGYDHPLISGIAEYKNLACRKIQILGFPSLSADMYQENILRVSNSAEATENSYGNPDDADFYLAPANDPFETASVLHRIFEHFAPKYPNATWYLSPLATKAQALGFCLFYLSECKNKPVSIIYPFGKSHSPHTGKGRARTWRYTFEFF